MRTWEHLNIWRREERNQFTGENGSEPQRSRKGRRRRRRRGRRRGGGEEEEAHITV